MTFIIILSVTLYLTIGVVLGLISKSIDPEDEMTAMEWFWTIVAWLPGLVCIGLEILVEYLKNRKNER